MNSAELRDRTLCVQCGPGVAVDEDGCCGMCGAQAFGPWADKAVAALERLETLEAGEVDHDRPTQCRAVHESGGWCCLREEGHDGPHAHNLRWSTPAPAPQQGGEDAS